MCPFLLAFFPHHVTTHPSESVRLTYFKLRLTCRGLVPKSRQNQVLVLRLVLGLDKSKLIAKTTRFSTLKVPIEERTQYCQRGIEWQYQSWKKSPVSRTGPSCQASYRRKQDTASEGLALAELTVTQLKDIGLVVEEGTLLYFTPYLWLFFWLSY